MQHFAGIDIGSTTIKIVLTNDAEELVDEYVCPTGSHFHRQTLAAFNHVLAENNLVREQITSVVSTGYGRKLFKEADDSISEISANAAGAVKIASSYGQVSTIINIGGQDSKIISLDDEGHIKNFAMNDKCAAGTGRFLDTMARNLEVAVDELGTCHLDSDAVPLMINSTCTVFAESEIIGLLAGGSTKAAIIAGIHYSIARRIVRLAKRVGALGEVIFFDGGPALNIGLVRALEDELMQKIVVPPKPQITTAYGAALIARETFMYEGAALDGDQ